MNFELKSVKFFPSFSQETNAFTAFLFVDGIKVASCENEGHGGETRIHAVSVEKSRILKTASDYCKALPAEKFEANGQTYEIPSTLEYTVDIMFQKWLEQKEQERHEKQILKDCLKAICWGSRNEYRLSGWHKMSIADVLKHKDGKNAVINKITELFAYKGLKTADEILNKNIPAELISEAQQKAKIILKSAKK